MVIEGVAELAGFEVPNVGGVVFAARDEGLAVGGGG